MYDERENHFSMLNNQCWLIAHRHTIHKVTQSRPYAAVAAHPALRSLASDADTLPREPGALSFWAASHLARGEGHSVPSTLIVRAVPLTCWEQLQVEYMILKYTCTHQIQQHNFMYSVHYVTQQTCVNSVDT